jgi:hypothetical protein
MANVEFATDQIVDLVLPLPSKRKREVLFALAAKSQTGQDQRMRIAEQQLRRLCAARGLDWDCMSEDEREALADGLIHEDRSCPS